MDANLKHKARDLAARMDVNFDLHREELETLVNVTEFINWVVGPDYFIDGVAQPLSQRDFIILKSKGGKNARKPK
jgi:hypothetical protein